jgi:GAF domain-containing protein
MWQQVLRGEAIGFDDFKLTIDRFGYPEDCYFNFSYSPVRDEQGRVSGVLVTFAETTRRVLNERRLRFLDDLAQATRSLPDPQELMRVTAAMLGRHLQVNRCAYAHVLQDQDTFDLVGDYNEGVESIVGRYRFADFGARVLDLMRRNETYVVQDVEQDPQVTQADLPAYRGTQIRSVICAPLHKQGRFVAAMAVHQATPRRWNPDDVELVQTVLDRCYDTLERMRSEAAQREESRLLEILNRTGANLASELDLEALVQQVTDAATELTGARFGAFFYNGRDDNGEAYLLYTLAGAPRAAFENFGHPRPTALFGLTFRGDPPIRLDDVLADPRYGQWGPHHGMPKGHLPVRSYLAVSVTSRSGEVIGGLFFGHPEPGVFTERSEHLAVGIAGQAAIAIDHARLYARSQQSAEERKVLLESERAARRDAEEASTVKDEFLATLSHELHPAERDPGLGAHPAAQARGAAGRTWRSGSRTARPRSASSTRGAASCPGTWRGSSSASGRPTAPSRAGTAGSAWACPSSGTWSRRMEGRSPQPAAARAAAPRSWCPSRCWTPPRAARRRRCGKWRPPPRRRTCRTLPACRSWSSTTSRTRANCSSGCCRNAVPASCAPATRARRSSCCKPRCPTCWCRTSACRTSTATSCCEGSGACRTRPCGSCPRWRSPPSRAPRTRPAP